VPDSEQYVLIRNLIILRRECRFYMIEASIYLLRFVLLTSSLKLIGHSVLHPIFVSFCGLAQSTCTVFKSMKGKKDFYKLTIEDVEAKKRKNSHDPAEMLIKTIIVPADAV
jgi:hypothetical protein